jgi:asparagine synthase (glutamine-hydrolysing)
MVAIVAVIDKSGQNAVPTALKMLRALSRNVGFEIYKLASPTQIETAERLESLANLKKMTSPVLVGCVCNAVPNINGHQPATSDHVNLIFDGKFYDNRHETSASTRSDSSFYRSTLQLAVKLVKKSNGDFAFAIPENKRIIAGRGSLGVRPLYLGIDSRLIALASEKKAFWSIGLHETDSFPPGNVAVIDREQVQFRPVRVLTAPEPRETMVQKASAKLQLLLRESVAQRTSDVEKVALAFSGGVDSSLLALLAKETGKKVGLVCASLERQPEVEHAVKAAETLRLPVLFSLHKLQEVEEVLPKVLYAIETPDPLQVSIAIPVYWAAEKAHEAGYTVMLAGQGADELFGGYKRYADTYLKDGGEQARKVITKDTLEMYRLNFERDSKVCDALGVELRLPFATVEIAEFALSLPVELLLEKSNGTARKLILRGVAKNMGLPGFVVEKPKKAMQYTTGVADALKRLAKKECITLKGYLLRQFSHVFGDSENGT